MVKNNFDLNKATEDGKIHLARKKSLIFLNNLREMYVNHTDLRLLFVIILRYFKFILSELKEYK